MRAVVIDGAGGPEVLRLAEVPAPLPAAGELLVDVVATALNRADILQRKGAYPPPAGAAPYPGLEAAGLVSAVGEGVTEVAVGDRVMVLVGGGGYAEQVVAPAATTMALPPTLSFAEGAAIPEAWLTAYSNMIEIGGLQAGERVLIHAGGSGVGTAAIQLARRQGATVFTTASADKLDRLRALGAELTIDYRAERFDERVLEATGGKGVELIIDFVGASYWTQNVSALALWGRLVLVGLLGGSRVEVELRDFLRKKMSVHGSSLRDRSPAEKGRLVAAFSAAALGAFASGELRPILDERRFTLDEVAEAHRYMEANRNVGKVILTVRPEP